MKRKTLKTQIHGDDVLEDRIDRELLMMNYKQLKIACIERGLPFEDVVNFDYNKLASYFVKNYEKPLDPNLVPQFDNWVEGQLELRGYKNGDVMLSPSLRLSYTGDLEKIKGKIVDPTSPKKLPRKELKEAKPKREKDPETGVVKGTKKSLTYQLAKKGLKVEQIIKRVTKEFPEAQVKSIKIWVKRALKSENGED